MRSHRYKRTDTYGYGYRDECQDCGVVRHYSWDPGWPGYASFYDTKGDSLDGEPPCRRLPEEIEEAVETMRALAPKT